jgi:hypothetical protein
VILEKFSFVKSSTPDLSSQPKVSSDTASVQHACAAAASQGCQLRAD